ncbi:hypothetical protein EPO05_01790, partial [Patescibacteria group bacterium]
MLIPSSGNLRDLLPGEKCGLSAVINVDEAGRLALVKSALIVHRGEVAFGAVSVHQGKFHPFKKRGSVHKRLDEVDAQRDLPGRVAIAHNRYATAGDPDARKNIQPLVWSESRFGTPIAIAHNGTLVNHLLTRKELLDHGAL